MKIIHCADIHLDSKMESLGTAEKKKERKAELLKAFVDMIEDGAKMGVAAIIIAGDLFDQSKVSAAAKKTVLGAIESNPGIEFYYLKGNHDKSDFLLNPSDIPANLHMFGDEWVTYSLGKSIRLTGAELTPENRNTIYRSLTLDADCFNIVTLHGQESLSYGGDKAEVINLKELRNKSINYLALGHVHSFKSEKLDGAGIYCYPGCLESRGFDETDKHGYVVLDIDEENRTCRPGLICHPIRNAYECSVDITGLDNSIEITNRVKAAVTDGAYKKSDMVKVVLTGDVSADCDKNVDFISRELEGAFYHYKVKDLTRIRIDYEKYRLDESLKGEFVRTVMADLSLSDDEKAEIIKIGIGALRGEEIE